MKIKVVRFPSGTYTPLENHEKSSIVYSYMIMLQSISQDPDKYDLVEDNLDFDSQTLTKYTYWSKLNDGAEIPKKD